MRASLVIFGVIFLVIGGLLYFVPMQEIKADTTTIGGGNVDTRTSSARVTVPTGWAYASAIIGFILLVIGLAIPNPIMRSNSKKDSYNKVVESKENTEVGDGNKRKIVRERTEKHYARKDEDSD
jgi:TRAP-type C4-dicarboxylate transport system permease small subunit